MEAAETVKISGASILRGGEFKPRSSPYAFRAWDFDGLRLPPKGPRAVSLPIITRGPGPGRYSVVEKLGIHTDRCAKLSEFFPVKKVGRTRNRCS